MSITITAGADVFPALPITGAATGAVTAPLVFGNLGGPPAQPSDWTGKVVLLDRGALTFAAKVAEVKRVGGLAAIIADNIADKAIVFTLAPNTSTIPAVSVTMADGADLKAAVGMIVRVGPEIVAPPPPPPPPPLTLPDPTGHAGEFLVVSPDGKSYVLTPRLETPGITLATQAAIGKPFALLVSSLGSPPLSYQWIKDGKNIASATAAQLTIASVAAVDAGQYVCQVTGKGGAAPSAAVTVTVK